MGTQPLSGLRPGGRLLPVNGCGWEKSRVPGEPLVPSAGDFLVTFPTPRALTTPAVSLSFLWRVLVRDRAWGILSTLGQQSGRYQEPGLETGKEFLVPRLLCPRRE